jgi:hypothetical protein
MNYLIIKKPKRLSQRNEELIAINFTSVCPIACCPKLNVEIHKTNSNKLPTRCNNFLVYYPDVYLQLNMLQAFSRPSSGAQ